MVKELLIKLGYESNSIDKIISWYQNYTEETTYNYIINMFNYLKNKEYSEKDIVKITKRNPSLLSYSQETIEDKFNYLKNKGYSEKDIVKMTKLLPALFSLSQENIEDKFEYLKSKGYSEKDIVKMTKQLSALFSYSKENIEDKFEYLKSKGYSEKDIIKMTKQLPALFGLNQENIDKKMEFYNQLDLGFIIIYDTMKLMQSVELTYARYRFLSDLGIIINDDNYLKLFYNQKIFSAQYGITNNELLNTYPYNQKIIKKV